jgi:FixJ family two-component response regulator
MTYILGGLLNKQIATAFSISVETVKIHRDRIMQKLEIGSVAELVRLCEKASIAPPDTQKL